MKYHSIAIEHEIQVGASPDAVYRMIADVTRMGEWSPECVETVWTRGDPGTVGAQFVGSNYEHDPVSGQEWRWDMLCEVVEAEPSAAFAWTVLTEAWDRETSVWKFTLRPSSHGTLLHQDFRMARPPSGWQPILDRHDSERQLELVAARRHRLEAGMGKTLEALAAAAETGQ